jgi:hypothetical protein
LAWATYTIHTDSDTQYMYYCNGWTIESSYLCIAPSFLRDVNHFLTWGKPIYWC